MTTQRGGKADPGADTQPIPVAPSYQEGSIQSVGGRPAGTDDSDRSGEGTLPAEGAARPEKGRDAFVSSEVSDKSSVPGRDSRTRS
jgi:hypothetical protein